MIRMMMVIFFSTSFFFILEFSVSALSTYTVIGHVDLQIDVKSDF